MATRDAPRALEARRGTLARPHGAGNITPAADNARGQRRVTDRPPGGLAGGRGRGRWSRFSDDGFSETSASILMVLDALECSARVLFGSVIILILYESIVGKQWATGCSTGRGEAVGKPSPLGTTRSQVLYLLKKYMTIYFFKSEI